MTFCRQIHKSVQWMQVFQHQPCDAYDRKPYVSFHLILVEKKITFIKHSHRLPRTLKAWSSSFRKRQMLLSVSLTQWSQQRRPGVSWMGASKNTHLFNLFGMPVKAAEPFATYTTWSENNSNTSFSFRNIFASPVFMFTELQLQDTNVRTFGLWALSFIFST